MTDKITFQWLERADFDLKTAEHLYKIKNFLYTAFMCQQCLEKSIKAYITSMGSLPPFIHNLLRLTEEAKLLESMSETHKSLLAALNPYYIKARYGEYKDSLSKVCTPDRAKYFLNGTKELSKWLKTKIK